MSRLKTLVRVAELKEAVARGEAARALAATRTAAQHYEDQLALLRSASVEGGTRESLATSASRQLLRAEAVATASADHDAARSSQLQALDTWMETRRRHKLFGQLAEREQERELARRERIDQQLADELAASRQARP